jgi:acetyl-CoA carboxylase biotin carboxyl carrier protein
MDAHEIKTLIEAMAASDLAEMEVSRNGWTLRLVRRATLTRQAGQDQRSPQAQPPAPADALSIDDVDAAETEAYVVRAPLAGMVYLSPSRGAPAFAPLGSAVEAGATVCVIEAMKVFVEVRAERGGTIQAVLVASGDEIDAGQPLLRIA